MTASASAADEIPVPNGSFEEWTTPDSWVASSWSMTNTVWVTNAAAHTGTYSQSLNQWNDSTTLSQTLTAPEGTYDVSLFVWANESLGSSALVANGRSVPIASGGATQIDGSKTWDEIRVEDVPVGADGALVIEIVLPEFTSTTLEGFLDDVTVTPSGPGGQEQDPGNEYLAEPGFEQGGEAWTVGGEVVAGGRADSAYHVAHAAAGAQETVQSVDQLPDGYYTLTAWVQNDGSHGEAYLFASGGGASTAKAALPRTNFPYDAADSWKKTTLRGVPVTSGRLEVGLDTSGGGSVRMDDLTLWRSETPYELLIGGDISMVNYVEDLGGRYADPDGRERDPLEILADNGWNVVRIRVYNEPGKGHGDGTYYVPDGYVNADDALDLARRASAAGLQIQLSFHYSDYWTNPGQQMIPHAWQDLIAGKSDAEAVNILEDEVYAFTKDVLDRMAAQGTTPEYVALGNETRSGMLFPYGTTGNWPHLARFYNAGARAVREVAPGSQVIIHLDDGGNTSTYQTYFTNADNLGVDYDIIGTSYYPYWTNKSAKQFADFATAISGRFGKPILVMETGFNWTGDMGAGDTGQLRHNGPYGDADSSTPELQRDFMIEVFNELQGVPGGMAIGNLYWDPVMLYAGGRTGWAYFESNDAADVNVVDNTALFDFDGKALPVLDAYRLNTRGAEVGTVAGRVVDSAGQAVAGATVTLASDDADRTVTTNEFGDFYFARVSPGDHEVRGEKAGLGSAGPQTVTAEAGARADVELGLPGAQVLRSVSGTVTGEGGEAVVGASVTISGENYASTRLTGDGGAFAFTAVPDGQYTLSVNQDGYVPGSEAVEVAASDVVRPVVLVADVGSVSGYVYAPGDQPVGGATVTVGGKSATTQADGTFLVEGIESGTGLVVTVSKAGYLTAFSTPVTVTHSETTSGVRILLPLEVPVANGSFETPGPGGDATAAGWTFTSDPDGAVTRQDRDSFGGTIDGRYAGSMWLASAYRGSIEQTVTVDAPGTYVVSAYVYSGVTGTLRMYVKDSDGQIIAVTEPPQSSGPRYTDVTAEVTGGSFTIGFDVDGAAGDWVVIDLVSAGYLGAASTDPAFPGVDALTADTRGPVHLDADKSARQGAVTIRGLGELDRVYVWVGPDPVPAGWLDVVSGEAVLTLPAEVTAGKHQIVALDESGRLVGWAPLKVTGQVAAAAGCKAGGWTSGGQPAFTNQGACVSSFASGSHAG